MRADRVLSLLMLLQSRGRLSAHRLAEELEVSERTIYRDVDALSAAGVPIYAERGPDGGFALLDSYRTDLTGLTDGEMRAMFLLTIPSALADLGLQQDSARALRKLLAAVPLGRRGDEARVRRCFYVDPEPWEVGGGGNLHLRALQDAVWRDRCVEIAYALPSGASVEQRVMPLGLVAKAGSWYVLHRSEGRTQALRVGDLVAVRPTGDIFERPDDFDLVHEWEAWCQGAKARQSYTMELRVSPQLARRLPRYGIEAAACLEHEAGHDGRVTVRAACESFEAARARVLALGGSVEVVAPPALRRSVVDYAEQIARRYQEAPDRQNAC